MFDPASLSQPVRDTCFQSLTSGPVYHWKNLPFTLASGGDGEGMRGILPT